jgi:hypothetical protein
MHICIKCGCGRNNYGQGITYEMPQELIKSALLIQQQQQL